MSLNIDIVSDVSCPWCYVGSKRLENALQKCNVKATITYHPFIIDMQTNKNGEEYLAYNRRRWGGDGWVYSMKDSAAQDGCGFAGWKYWPFSLHCHRLMCYANEIGKGQQLMGQFFKMNYEENKNLSLSVDLLEACNRIQLDLTEVQKIIGSDRYKTEVMDEIRKWSGQNVNGVPYFIVTYENGQVQKLHGAVETSTWEQVLNNVKNKK